MYSVHTPTIHHGDGYRISLLDYRAYAENKKFRFLTKETK